MTVIDLFSGSKSVASSFQACGFKVITIDNNPALSPDICVDVRNLRRSLLPGPVDVVWMSPPCTTLSTMSLSIHFRSVKLGFRRYFYVPKSEAGFEAIAVLRASMRLLIDLNPMWYFIENPRGGMRHLGEVSMIPYRREVYYSSYGMDYPKPTDIFTNFPGWNPIKANRPGCRSKVTDLPNAYERGKVPRLLIEEIAQSLNDYRPKVIRAGLVGMNGQIHLDV